MRVALLPSGNLVVAEGSLKRIAEVKVDGTVVAKNANDFPNWATHVAISGSGNVYIKHFNDLLAYSSGITGAKTSYVSALPGGVQNMAWGGANRSKLYVLTAASQTSFSLLRYDNPSATVSGAYTKVADFGGHTVQSGNGGMAVTRDGTAYIYNFCALTRVSPTGVVKVLRRLVVNSDDTVTSTDIAGGMSDFKPVDVTVLPDASMIVVDQALVLKKVTF